MPKANAIYEQAVLIRNDSIYNQNKGNQYFVSAIEKLLTYRDLKALDKKEKIASLGTFSNMNEVAGRYEWTETQLAPHQYHCQLCGTEIIYRYILTNVDTGKKVDVGSECVTRHPIRITGYNSIEALKKAVMSKKEELSIVYKWQLWEESSESKLFPVANKSLFDFAKVLPAGVSNVSNQWSNSLENAKMNGIRDAFKTMETTYPMLKNKFGYYFYSSSEICKRISNKLDSSIGRIDKTFKFEVPFGKKNTNKFSFDFYQESFASFYIQEEVQKSFTTKLYEVQNEIHNISWKIRNNIYQSNLNYKKISALGGIRKIVRFYKYNKKEIKSYIEWVNDYRENVLNNLKVIFAEEEQILVNEKQAIIDHENAKNEAWIKANATI